MKHTLYLYLDNFSFSDCYATQCIACEAFMPNKKGSRTLSRGTENFLFLTHIKADVTSRHTGIADQLINWPVTLECVLDDEKMENFPVVFLLKSSDQMLERGDIKDYDENKHIGCFAFAEVPFSTVTKILFENENQLIDSDKSIFPDFLWEEKKVGIVDVESFNEELNFTVNEEDILALIGAHETAFKITSTSNKYRAAILQLINGSKTWRTGKFQASFDTYLLEYFAISEDTAKEILSTKQMPAPEAIFRTSTEKLNLIPLALEKDDVVPEQKILNGIVSVFLQQKVKCTPASIHSLLEEIGKEAATSIDGETTLLTTTLTAIEGCCLNSIGYSVDGVLEDIERNYSENSVLKALLFVIKNPADYEKFVLSLSLYKVDSITARRAMVLWGFLNGMHGIPAKGYGRDNAVLWENIEWRQQQVLNNLYIGKQPVGVACGIEITSEEIITFEEVHAFLTADAHHVSKAFLANVYTLAKNCDRKLSKEDPYCVYTLNEENFYSKLPRLNKDVVQKAELDAFEKAYTRKIKELLGAIKKTAALDNYAIYQNWIVDSSNFKKIWDLIEDQIKAYYIRKRG